MVVWVHPENILEVKTILLRRLPVLIFNPQTSKIAEGSGHDPTVTSIYFDDPKFSLYQQKIAHQTDASSLRLRWYGQLAEQSDIIIEKKVIKSESGESEEKRFHIKPKYVLPFANGEYNMEKSIKKMEDRTGQDPAKTQAFKDAVSDVRDFITKTNVQPMLRANYTRTAFEIPGDDRIRVSLDTNLAFIREDALDKQRPCRDPKDWHRSDIDKNQMEYPFTNINKGEINRLPFAILEIKVRGGKNYEWVQDLMSSHLVKEVPRFSKFIHGSAVLFEDYVNAFPFWLGLADTDIRTDPQTAFNNEQDRRAAQAAENHVVGSLFGSKASPARHNSLRATYGSPSTQSVPKALLERTASDSIKATPEMTRTAANRGPEPIVEVPDNDDDEEVIAGASGTASGLRSLFPSFSTSKFAQKRRNPLPPGVTKPDYWIKDQGPLQVEAKVWLANQRTFIKWQHVTVLLASLSLGLFNAAGKDNSVARALALIYTLFAVFTGIWGWSMYIWRGNLIRQRSGRDFDNRLGPVVVCGGLAVALVLNFAFKVCLSLNNDKRSANEYRCKLHWRTRTMNQTRHIVILMLESSEARDDCLQTAKSWLISIITYRLFINSIAVDRLPVELHNLNSTILTYTHFSEVEWCMIQD